MLSILQTSARIMTDSRALCRIWLRDYQYIYVCGFFYFHFFILISTLIWSWRPSAAKGCLSCCLEYLCLLSSIYAQMKAAVMHHFYWEVCCVQADSFQSMCPRIIVRLERDLWRSPSPNSLPHGQSCWRICHHLTASVEFLVVMKEAEYCNTNT